MNEFLLITIYPGDIVPLDAPPPTPENRPPAFGHGIGSQESLTARATALEAEGQTVLLLPYETATARYEVRV